MSKSSGCKEELEQKMLGNHMDSRQISKEGFMIKFRPLLMAAVSLLVIALVVQAEVLFEDKFSNPKSGWFVGTRFRDATWGYTDDGQYRVLVTDDDRVAWSEAPIDDPVTEFCVDVDLVQLQNPGLAKQGEIGIYYGQPKVPYRPFFTVGVQPDGFMDVGISTDEGWDRIVPKADLERVFDARIIHRAPDKNHLRVVAQNGMIRVIINNEPALEYGGDLVEGFVGVYAWAFDEPNMNARFDNFVLTTPDCQR